MHPRARLGAGLAHDVCSLQPGFVADPADPRFLLARQPTQQRGGLGFQHAFDGAHAFDPQGAADVLHDVRRRAAPANVGYDGEQRRARSERAFEQGGGTKSIRVPSRNTHSGRSASVLRSSSAVSPGGGSADVETSEPEPGRRRLATDVDDACHVSPAG